MLLLVVTVTLLHARLITHTILLLIIFLKQHTQLCFIPYIAIIIEAEPRSNTTDLLKKTIIFSELLASGIGLYFVMSGQAKWLTITHFSPSLLLLLYLLD